MLHPASLSFLKQLQKNNNKPWFEENRNLYENAKADFENFVGEVIVQLGKKDTDIATLNAKKCTFRQHRDIRFSKNKTPFKINMGASFDKGGKNSGLAGYYLHMEPGNSSMAGGGLWMPDAPLLKKIRQEIDYNWEEFSAIVNATAFKKTYGGVSFGEHQLIREPKGYAKENPAIEYLKLKSFVAIRRFTDEEMLEKNLLAKVVSSFSALMPFIRFLNRALV